MFYLPHGWKTSASDVTGFWGVEIAQLNFQNLGPAARPSLSRPTTDHVTLAHADRICAQQARYQCQSNADSANRHLNLPKLYASRRAMRFGVWHELIIHAHWATDSSGKIDAWHRIKGQRAWQKTASLRGYPTLQDNPDGSYPSTTIDMIGAYRGPSHAPTSVWLDGFSRSGSFAAAAAHLP